MGFAYVTTYSSRWGERRHPDGEKHYAHTLTVHTRTCGNLPSRLGHLTNSPWSLRRVLQDEPQWLAQQGTVRYLPCPRCVGDRDGMLAFLAACRERLAEIHAEQVSEVKERQHERRQMAAANDASAFRSSLDKGSRNRAEYRLRQMYPLTFARLLQEERLRSRIALWLNQFGYCTDYRPIESALGTYCAHCKGTAGDHRVRLGGAA